MKPEQESRPGETFLGRWSRRKAAARQEAAAPPAEPVVPAQPPKPDLPPVENLSLESDFSGFMHPEVDEDLRRRALRRLFSDPHFNVMDGLDVYIDDYGKADPIPPEMLKNLAHAARTLGLEAEEPARAVEAVVAGSDRDDAPAGAESGAGQAPSPTGAAGQPAALGQPAEAEAIRDNMSQAAERCEKLHRDGGVR